MRVFFNVTATSGAFAGETETSIYLNQDVIGMGFAGTALGCIMYFDAGGIVGYIAQNGSSGTLPTLPTVNGGNPISGISYDTSNSSIAYYHTGGNTVDYIMQS